MGGQHSKEDAVIGPPPPPPDTDHNGNHANNSNNSNNNDNSNTAIPCGFCLDGFLAKTTARRSDPIGTPMPETPLFRRKQRQQVQQALRGSGSTNATNAAGMLQGKLAGGRFLPPGLEAESSKQFDSFTNRNDDDNNDKNTETDAVGLYEGPDCEALLHAKYELLEAIGVGSTSTVHRCVKRHDHSEYACKVIDVQTMEERFAGMMDQFQTEIAALRKLQHPNIIQLYDVYLTGEKIYIVMELMQGGEIFDYVVQKGTLTEDEAALIVRKVCSAIVYMHSNNICHRDLKPENLLLKQRKKSNTATTTNNNNNNESSLDVKIIDFGLSKALAEEQPVARTFLGTRGYLAPEMLQRREYTKAVDTWALGVIVFVLLCGCLPFDDDSATVPSDDLVRTKFVLRFPRWAQNLSPSAKDLLHRLLDVNPRTRYTAEMALRHPWVQGETAPKGNLLASPGRISSSPAFRNAARRKQAAQVTTSSPPPKQVKRKTSI